ncbi:MAG: hypothetical protein AAGE80_05185 [Pseudomonadota bacterium]
MTKLSANLLIGLALGAMAATSANASSIFERHDGKTYVDQSRVIEETSGFAYGLPEAPEGTYYAVINGDMFTIDRKTGRVVDIIPIAAALMK